MSHICAGCENIFLHASFVATSYPHFCPLYWLIQPDLLLIVAPDNMFHLFFSSSQIVGVWFCEQGELQQMDAMLGRIFEMHPSFEASRSGRVGTGASSSGTGAAAGAQRQQVGAVYDLSSDLACNALD